MKLNKHLTWIAATTLMVTAVSCQNNDSFEQSQEQLDFTDAYGTGSRIVTISLTPETSTGTRAVALPYVSNGQKVNKLYFEIYESSTEIKNVETGTTPYIKEVITTSSYPVTIKLAVDPDKNYKAAFWAQYENGSPSPFTVTDLKAVKVSYANAANNDDFRDAFCAATDNFAGSAGSISVTLHRPFAQINVGTTGADYNNYISGNIYPHRTVTYSKIVVKGVYDEIDVVNDKIGGAGNVEATFDFAPISNLYAQATVEEYLKVKLNGTDLNSVSWGDTPNKVEVGENGFFPFKNEYPTIKTKGEGITTDPAQYEKNNLYLTEEFKYLSMCYVLVPFPRTTSDTGYVEGFFNEYYTSTYPHDPYYSTTVNSVDVYFAETAAAGASGASAYQNDQKYFTVNTVPVHRNWRTNILGGLADTNPGNPDDPSSLFYNVSLTVNLCPIYFGEHNGQENSQTWTDINHGQFPTDGDNDNLHGDHATSGD